MSVSQQKGATFYETSQNVNTINRPIFKQTLSDKRQQDETKQLKMLSKFNFEFKNIVDKLSLKLRELSLETNQLKREKSEKLGIKYEEPADLVMEQQLRADPEKEELLHTQLSVHLLGPLIDGYEQQIAQLQKELKQTKFQFRTQMEDCQEVIQENEKLRDALEI